MYGDLRMKAFASAIAAMALVGCTADSPIAPDATTAGAVFAKGTPGMGGGGGDEGLGNNLSWPVIFANNKGLGGNVIAGPADFAATGLRPLASETGALSELHAKGVGPFWYSGNVAESYLAASVFWQKSPNVWQAQWMARSAATTPVIVDWGDNLRSVKFAATSVVRVEHVLNASDGTTMQGYTMDVVVNPSSPTEQQGIYDDGNEDVTAPFTPTVFTDRARLKLQKLDGPGGNVTYTYLDKAVFEGLGTDGRGAYSAEINVGGKVLFGYVWNLKNVVMPPGVPKDGWWRITFALDTGSGVEISGVGLGDEVLATHTGAATVAEIAIGTSRGGGKKP